MAFIESHQELARHPKTRKLARALHVSIPCVIGHLHLLWWWCLDYADHGDILSYDAADIADAMMWEGDPDQLIEELVRARFLDRSNGQLEVHGFWERARLYVERKEANKLRMRERRARKNPDASDSDDYTNSARAEHVQRTATARPSHDQGLQYSTVDNSTEQYSNSLNGKQKSSSSKPATAGKTRALARTTTTFLNLSYPEQARWVADVPDDIAASWSVGDRREALKKMLAVCKEKGWTPSETRYHEWLRNEKRHVPENATEVVKWSAILASFNKETGKCSNGQSWNRVEEELQAAKRRERDQRRSANGEAKLVYLESSYPEPSS